MHEYSIIEQLVEDLLAWCQSNAVQRIKEVSIRRNSTFSEDSLHQAYQMLTENTMLEGSELIVEAVEVEQACRSCGHSQVVTVDDIIGHLFVCPECGAYQEIDEANGLEILSVTVSDIPSNV